LRVSDLTTEFAAHRGSVTVLHDIALAVAPGEVLGIVGEAGAGKTVLVRSLLQLLPENGRIARGQVLLKGRELLRISPAELRQLRGKEIAHILPNAKVQLNPLVRIGDMMSAVVRAHQKVSQSEARQQAVALLNRVGIPDPERRLSAFPHELSGGMAQRVCIALALIHNPGLIIADEPTAGLDVTVQRQVLDIMADLVHQRQAAQLIVTRDLGIVAHYCQRVAVMRAGYIVEEAPVMELFDHPQHPYTQQILRAASAARVTRLVRTAV
jgi:ABC-type dipeptide/oligopeptide/nickel transport system ATPase component